MQQPEDLHAVRDRLRFAWASRRVCGLSGVAMTLRVDRLIALCDASRLTRADPVRMALEAEATALCVRPLPRP